MKFIGVQGNEIESMRREPDLKNAERLTLTESNENSSRMKSMEPMKPMHYRCILRSSEFADVRRLKKGHSSTRAANKLKIFSRPTPWKWMPRVAGRT